MPMAANCAKGLAVVPVCFGISFTATLLNQAEALLHVADGSVSITTGAVDMGGQGVQQRIRRVVALTLGVDGPASMLPAPARAASPTCHRPPPAPAPISMVKPPARRPCACWPACARWRRTARLPARAVVFADDAATQTDGRRIAWPELIVAAYARRLPLSALAHYATPGLHFDPPPTGAGPLPTTSWARRWSKRRWMCCAAPAASTASPWC